MRQVVMFWWTDFLMDWFSIELIIMFFRFHILRLWLVFSHKVPAIECTKIILVQRMWRFDHQQSWCVDSKSSGIALPWVDPEQNTHTDVLSKDRIWQVFKYQAKLHKWTHNKSRILHFTVTPLKRGKIDLGQFSQHEVLQYKFYGSRLITKKLVQENEITTNASWVDWIQILSDSSLLTWKHVLKKQTLSLRFS